MSTLSSKKIILGISGGIAAYKSADLVRRLREAGAEVRVVMTSSARAFITPLTLQALSGHPVHYDLCDEQAEAAMGHIELARWADLIVLAPASANCLARISHGLADDLFTTLCLATSAPLVVAPAMNQAMWHHPATQANIAQLRARGVRVLGPGQGEQACGDHGLGRMLEPLAIVAALQTSVSTPRLRGKRVLLTAGPTREYIDPVRYVSNLSSGKMGYALAQAAVDAGADVILVSGPTQLTVPAGVKRLSVETAQAMYEQVMAQLAGIDVFIATAAVADYRCQQTAGQKLAKNPAGFTLQLTPNPDIVAAVAATPNKPFTVGFAAQTDAVVALARQKLVNKKLDLIIANEVGRADRGFDVDHNAATALWPDGEQTFALMPKSALAQELMDLIITRYEYATGTS